MNNNRGHHIFSSSRVLHPGVLCVVQRFRNDLGLFVHLHCLVTDGCFEEVAEDRPRFLPTRGLTEDHLVRVLAAVHRDLAAALDEPATEPDAGIGACVADIRGFFDSIDHEWLRRFVEHRIADRRIVRLIQKWLKSGILQDGVKMWAETGSPQGATISPLLANIYLHYVFDLWVGGAKRGAM